ncbi:MAG: transglutaminase-like domain-containing protein, partial [Candidatus Portnoybacteria bacterium]|nr:transglutaminase-like domain-containing protein [Candidatus Portnoybacteria bacterium]
MQNYLKDTKQIFITPGIRNIIREFDRKDIDLALEILEWIHNNFENINDNTEKKMKLFRKRTADEIIKSKKLTGCTDYAIVFIALARAKKIPTKYVEAIKKTWLDT